MTVIKSLFIKGLRGIKNELTLLPGGNSFIIFGDNGSGKSSITDTLEWFYKNRVSHLTGEEIGRIGQEALKNTLLPHDEESFTSIEFNDNSLDSQKKIYHKKNSIQSEYSNTTPQFLQYLENSQKENLILRYRDLFDFILASKKEKLDTLSTIIGLSEVTYTRDTLRKVLGELKKEYKMGNFDSRISFQQSKIIGLLGRNINSETQLVEAVNEIIQSLGIKEKNKTADGIDDLLAVLSKPDDYHLLELQTFYNKITDWIFNLPAAADTLDQIYTNYYKHYQDLANNIEKLNKIVLENLLTEGIKAIKTRAVGSDLCPLCLQPKNLCKLLYELETRTQEIREFKKEKIQLNEIKKNLEKEIKNLVQKIDILLTDNNMMTEENRMVKRRLEGFKNELEKYSIQLNRDISPGQHLLPPAEIRISCEPFEDVRAFCLQKQEAAAKSKRNDFKYDAQRKILLSLDTYRMIDRLKKERDILENQQRSMELIYTTFLKKQKECIDAFLNYFSGYIDEFYQFLNPGERVEKFALVPLERDEDLVGITLEYTFHENRETPPQKYLSESHLNCLGIVFFLTSVKAFNRWNRFFILDDVMSQFDNEHADRFTRLLFEKFPDYQVIVMSHEKKWVERILDEVKEKNWQTYIIERDEEGNVSLKPFINSAG